MEGAVRRFVLRSPPWGAVAAIVFVSVALSVAALFLVTFAAGKGFSPQFPLHIGIAVTCPLLVATPVSWLIVRLVHEAEAARRMAQEQAWRDDLTGLLARRRFSELAQRELDLARRSGRALCAVVLDLDDFKRINDRHGHGSGDDVLRSLAGCVRQGLRGTDLAGRWGGEEFALVLPDTEVGAALEVMQRLLAALRGHRVPVGPGVDAGCTASIGLAAWQHGAEGLDLLFRRADAAMYAAKSAGKDRVVVAGG